MRTSRRPSTLPLIQRGLGVPLIQRPYPYPKKTLTYRCITRSLTLTLSLTLTFNEQAALAAGGPPPPSDSTEEPPLRKQRRAARPRLPRALQGTTVCARAGEVPCGDSG